MNIILKNALIGCALVAICFGLGRGVKWAQNYDWNKKTEDRQITRLEDKIERLEDQLDRMDTQFRRLERDFNSLNIDRLEEKLTKIEEKQKTWLAQLQREWLAKNIQEMMGKERRRILLEENDDDDDDEKSDYAGKTCHSQRECGGKKSGYFCNYGGMHTKDVCEKTNPLTEVVDGVTYYYNKTKDLKKWCRTATESAEDRSNPENCNWGYLSYDSAQAWCDSIGKKLVDPSTIRDNCNDFDFLPEVTGDQQYWTTGLRVIHLGQKCSIQDMVRGDGYCYAGGVICK